VWAGDSQPQGHAVNLLFPKGERERERIREKARQNKRMGERLRNDIHWP